MARLLAAEREAALDHLLHHVLVADRGADHLDAAIAKRDLEPDVAHHRRDHRGARQPAAILEIDRRHQQDGVAVDDLARRDRRTARDRRRRRTPRRVAPSLATTALASPSRCVDPQSRLMLRPLGVTPIASTSNPSCANSDGASGAVAPFAQSITIFDPASGPARLHDLEQMLDVVLPPDAPARSSPVAAIPSGVARNSPRRIRHQRLDRRLELLGQLRAGAAEHLDAVVFVGIVRRGDHDAGVKTLGARQIRNRGRRHDAGADHRGAFRRSVRARARPRSTRPTRACRGRSR